MFDLTHRLNGIVGPNGCGKSNIIDAIRWVMGESSAKQLRGEAMTDVIFSGATSRKASSFASIELVFDNTDGRIGGQWAAFGEISIKRILERTGQSTYYLNGAKCRRKDITDIFLGTGLGARSYAIIEQGMISRIVESKPDELRLVFEEAAGVSKYKEQKRETEIRIEHTRQNLLRLLDVREELSTQLTHLEKQAKKAETYQVLKREERLLQYIALKQQKAEISAEQADLTARLEALEAEFHQAVSFYNELILKHNANKAALTEKSSALSVATETFHAEQREILTLEHKIAAIKTSQARTHEDQAALNASLVQVDAEITELQIALETLTETEGEESDALMVMTDSLFELTEHLESLNGTFDAFLQVAKTLNEEVRQLEREADVAKNSITHFETQQIHGEARIAKLQLELSALEAEDGHSDQLIELQAAMEEKALSVETLQQSLSDAEEQGQTVSEARRDVEARIHQSVRTQSEYEGRLSALTLLQNAVLAQKDGQAPLFESLTIAPEWQKAAEVVLARYLTLSTLENPEGYALAATECTFTEQHLGHYIQSDKQLGALLSHVYVARNELDLALLKADLKMHEWIVMPNGDLYGVDWFIAHIDGAIDGVLERAEEMNELERRLQDLNQLIMQLESDKQALIAQESAVHSHAKEISSALESAKAEQAAIEKAWALLNKEHMHVAENQARITSELAALKEAHEAGQLEIEENRITLESLLMTLEETQLKKSANDAELSAYEAEQKAKQAEAQNMQQSVNDATRQLDNTRFQLKETEKNLARLVKTHSELQQKLQEKTECEVDSDELILLEESLLIHSDNLITVDTEKTELAAEVAALQTAIEQEETLKAAQEKHIESQKEVIQSLMVREAEFKAHQAHIEKDWQDLLETVSIDEQHAMTDEIAALEDADVEPMLKSVQQKLSRLGAVNLVAIEECQQLSQRKQYLDEQDQDLNAALSELEIAIHKIDQETRERFMSTFNAVNQDFSKLFPRLFGGGEAYLELKGEDALSSGVNIIARPPGKKPGTIHLLSGGEKALTAAALVFAIFNLNPAPFCILDEVDAPLDEANVRRLGALLKEMSDRVQFIFITHNKTTMSVAESLIGVTMSEPGVSRLVSVDLAEAEKMAE
ncbi:chromosome segregation protein SMC [Wohlfahrtiimonas chitiniclastica]|uniref:chromosome segregation protein SMC n=1 Tax=Wohlfahrtiimonas chitiniclastica TaxID=400946 RepID=UPI003CCFF2DB